MVVDMAETGHAWRSSFIHLTVYVYIKKELLFRRMYI